MENWKGGVARVNPSSTVKQTLQLIIKELETKSGKNLHYIFTDFLP